MRSPAAIAVPWWTAVLLIATVASGCKAPPWAPTEFNELCAFLFQHNDDEDPASLALGLENLAVWMVDHPEEPQDGYTVDTLTKEHASTLPEGHTVRGVNGAAVVTESPFDPITTMYPLVAVDQTEVFPDMYAFYERDWTLDPDCFASTECDWIEVENDLETQMPLNIVQHTKSTGQFRWVELEDGLGMVNRSWMKEPAEYNIDWPSVDEQFYLSVMLPKDGGGGWRLQAAWMVASINDGELPESTALNMVIRGFRSRDADLYVYIEENQ